MRFRNLLRCRTLDCRPSLMSMGMMTGVVLLASSAPAAVVVSDDFQSYNTDGTGATTQDSALHQNTGGTGWGANAWNVTSAAQAGLVVVAPSTPLSFSVTNANSQTVGTVSGGNRALQFNSSASTGSTITATRTFGSGINSNEAWGRILFRYDAGVIDSADFLTVYFGGGSTSNPNFHMFGNPGTTADFGIRDGGTGIGNGGPDITSSDIGTKTYLMVARLRKSVAGTGNAYDRLDMWVNPVLDASNNLPAATMTGNIANSSFASFSTMGIRAANLDASPADVLLMDELVFGTDVTDVVPGAVGVVPEPGSIAIGGLVVGGLLVRRRRK